MEDLSWLSNLGSDKLLALAIGMILVGLLVPRWVLKRQERAFDQLIEAYRVMATTVNAQTDIMRQVWHVLERLPLDVVVDTAQYQPGNNSQPESASADNGRHLRRVQPPPSQMHTPNGSEWTHSSSELDERSA
jgi:hypothetical protein